MFELMFYMKLKDKWHTYQMLHFRLQLSISPTSEFTCKFSFKNIYPTKADTIGLKVFMLTKATVFLV